MYDKLKAVLGDDGVVELEAMIKINTPAPTAVPVAVRDWRAMALGAVKSWTVWLGGALVVLPTVLPDLQELLTPEQFARATKFVGVVVILLRLKTNESLKDKGETKP